jgi:cysteine desulfurase
MHIDLLSLSGHKIYGPKGVGALYVRRKPKVKLVPLFHGGGHESGYRSGTLATHQIVGLGKACQLMFNNRIRFLSHVKHLRDIFLKKIKELTQILINTQLDNSYPGIVNITFKHVDGEALVAFLHRFAISMGSACNSSSIESSFVLRAIGLTPRDSHSSLRFSFGQYTTEKEAYLAAENVVSSVNKLRSLSPHWRDTYVQ